VIIGFLIIDPISSLLFGIIFVFVALHEVSHSLVAKRKGIKVKKIILLPIGGMAVIENIEQLKPVDEIKMAIAGPLFNFVVAAICLGIAYWFNYPIWDKIGILFGEGEMAVGELVFLFCFYANMMLGAFNLFVPAFPMDGGRIFRALLALKMNYTKATKIAKNVGIVFGILLGIFGLFTGNIFVIVIGMFIIFGANAEYQGVLITNALNKINFEKLITREIFLLDGKTPINQAVAEMIQHRITNALVDENKIFDVTYLHSTSKTKWNNPVIRVSKRVPIFKKSDNIVKIVRTMSEKNFPFVMISDKGQILGVVYLEDIHKMLKVISVGKNGL